MSATPLDVHVVHRQITLGDTERQHLDAGIERLNARSAQFPQRSLRIILDSNARDSSFCVQVALELDNKTIIAKDEDPHLLGALDKAFRKVTRQLREFKSLLRRSHLRTRVRALRDGWNDRDEGAMPAETRQRDIEGFRNDAEHHVGRLSTFIKDELANLPLDDPHRHLPVEDLVDEVIVAAYEDFMDKPASLSGDGWLMHIASDVMGRQLRARQTPTVSIESLGDVPPPPSVDDDPFGGLHRLHFSGEIDLETERSPEPRVLGATSVDPSEALEEADLIERAASMLRELPEGERRCFELHLQGFDLDEITQAVQLPRDRVRTHLRTAEIYLRSRAKELGVDADPPPPPPA
jgi:RNA polymerase sigma factor (sigma-70 family)